MVQSKPKFPIVEAFGYLYNATSEEARASIQDHWCPFSDTACEKFRQYGYGYCSVQYAAAGDARTPRTYAVCDHRLDGSPVDYVLKDHFGEAIATLVPEIVLTKPRTSFDYVAHAPNNIENIIAIETQAIDLRGGGVGPAWRALSDGRTDEWRSYFTEEAKQKGRKDVVAYGVNMANIYKRLGLQVAVKGSFLKDIKVPFYVLMQNRPFEYLRGRIQFSATELSWDISFVTFEYTGKVESSGHLEFAHVQTVRTSLGDYVAAMSTDNRSSETARADFLQRVKRKASLK